MASTASIRVIKQFTYRGASRQFSNRYHFDGTTPPDSTHWTTLSDAIVTAEKACYMPLATPGAEIVATVGYAPGSEVPVFNKTYTTNGTGSFTNAVMATISLSPTRSNPSLIAAWAASVAKPLPQ